ncbi:MAG: hypothetical protein ACYTGX_17290, partial [Planctomycetota bacterium]
MRRLGRTAMLTALAAGAAWLAGCRTYIPIDRYEPGRVRIGAARELVLCAAAGRPSARQDVARALHTEVRRGRYFGFKDRRAAGGEIVPGRDRIELRGLEGPAEGEIGLFLEVYEFHVDERMREERSFRDRRTIYGTERVETITEIPTFDAEVWIGVTLFDHTGRPLLREREYRGTASGDADRVGSATVRRNAAASALRKFLGDITPRRVREHVLVDRSDGGQAATIHRAARGDLEGAARDAKRYYEMNLRNPAAAYNLAVFTEALGEYA